MKRDRKEIVRSFKAYNVVMTNIWQLITILLIGILLGYLLEKNGTNKELNYMAISVIGSIIIGVPVFFVGLIKGINKLDKKNNKEDNEENNKYLV